MLIGIFDNKQKKRKVNKEETKLVEKKPKEANFYYNTIYLKDNSLVEDLIKDFKELGYKNKSDYLTMLIRKGLESKRIEKDILNSEGLTEAIKELITRVESLESAVVKEQSTLIKLITEVIEDEWYW